MNNAKPSFIVLIPGIVFFLVFITINFFYTDTNIREISPIFAAFIAIIISIFTFQKNETFNERIESFIEGSSEFMVIHMCYIFILSTIFITILEHTGSINSAVNICLNIVPTSFILPGFFLISSFFSFTAGTSIGTIAAIMPIAINISDHIYLNPSIAAAAIICGSIFGENVSILSDTTILSVKITGTTVAKKFYRNLKILLPAFIGTILLLLYQNSFIIGCLDFHTIYNIGKLDIIKCIPYLITFYLALTGLDIIFVMIMGIMSAICLGLILNKFTMLAAINFMFDGFYNSKDMVSLFILVALLSGLANIMKHNGAIEYLMHKIKHRVSNKCHAKLAIFFLVALVNICIAINSIAIMIAGPAVNEIARKYDIESTEAASILDILSCVAQGLLPYSPQLLLAGSLAHVSVISLLPYLYYQFIVLICLLTSILWSPCFLFKKTKCFTQSNNDNLNPLSFKSEETRLSPSLKVHGFPGLNNKSRKA